MIVGHVRFKPAMMIESSARARRSTSIHAGNSGTGIFWFLCRHGSPRCARV